MYNATITEYEDNKSRKLTLSETENGKNSILDQPPEEKIPAEQPLIWRNIIALAVLHAFAIYMVITRYHQAKFWTWIFHTLFTFIPGLGITAGAHRYWAHKSYNAKLPLRILLASLFCMCGMTHLTKWIRVHRTHHRYTDTSADPHNSKRGFFFSHVGWLMMKHHPAIKEYGKNVDMSDVAADPVIRFFDKYYPPIMLTLTFILPAVIPVYVWNETWTVSISATFVRYVIALHAIFSVNSFAHLWGTRPYDRNIKATNNSAVAFFALGEGWHNYHHCFPWDYKTSELGLYRLNYTTAFIDFMAWLGLAYNLRTSNPEMVDRLRTRKGDGMVLSKLNAK